MPDDETLRKEVTLLGRLFGDVLRRFEGDAAFELVERVRADARRFRDGDDAAGDSLAAFLSTLSGGQLRTVIRAFSGFLELANLAEDRQRVRALRERERRDHPAPRRESVGDAIRELREQGFTADRVARALAGVRVDLVFTAHPTEAKRRSLRQRVREVRGALARLDDADLLPAEREEATRQLGVRVAKLWQTELTRPTRPTVLEEVTRGLSFQPVLWATAPRVLSDLRRALRAYYPGEAIDFAPPLRFGSWMGGDRDGNPFVTPQITAQTCEWLRRAALADHRAACDRLIDSLSLACGDTPACRALHGAVDAALAAWPPLAAELDPIAPAEGYRRMLRVVAWRLGRTAEARLDGPPPPGAYADPDALLADLAVVRASLEASGNADVAEAELTEWVDQVRVFGFQTARLDVRQHSSVYARVMEELWRAGRFLDEDAAPLSEEARCALLRSTLPVAHNLSPLGLSDEARETLDLFRVLRRIARRFGMGALGTHIVSMTHHPSDLLTVLWLWRWSERTAGGAPGDRELRLPIVPLFETISDLESGAEILAAALETPEYREHVAGLGDEQIVMIGYSDSTKDGGYTAAQWALQRSQLEVFATAKRLGVHVTFFHGRGGALGRGGGPAARAVLSLPSETFDGSLRLTEQGEVLAERYDDPHIAHRHLEQMIWSALTAATHDTGAETRPWHELMDAVAADALAAYRRLVEHPGFVPFFRAATPIAGIERLPIGSRPSRRKGGDRIEDLRAIPWVFSWTQCRCLLPAWFGLGSAVAPRLEEDAEALRGMYEDWRFFRAMIDNSALALAKANPSVFRRYAVLAGDEPAAREIAQILEDEYDRTRDAVLGITGCDELLGDVPWLRRSITVRNGYVDPLNFVQVELMRRAAAATEGSPEAAELDALTQLAIKGVAAGMRTTG